MLSVLDLYFFRNDRLLQSLNMLSTSYFTTRSVRLVCPGGAHNRKIYLPLFLFLSLSHTHSFSFSVYCPFFHLFSHFLSVLFSLCFSVCRSICLSVYLSLSISLCLPLCLSLSQKIYREFCITQ